MKLMGNVSYHGLKGFLKPALMCYLTPLLLDLGAGTTCQTPVDQFSSEFFTEPATVEEEECDDEKDEKDRKSVNDIVKEILDGGK